MLKFAEVLRTWWPRYVQAATGPIPTRHWQAVEAVLTCRTLRISERLSLRIHCINMESKLLTAHDGKGLKDRSVPLPLKLKEALRGGDRGGQGVARERSGEGPGRCVFAKAVGAQIQAGTEAVHLAVAFSGAEFDPRAGVRRVEALSLA